MWLENGGRKISNDCVLIHKHVVFVWLWVTDLVLISLKRANNCERDKKLASTNRNFGVRAFCLRNNFSKWGNEWNGWQINLNTFNWLRNITQYNRDTFEEARFVVFVENNFLTKIINLILTTKLIKSEELFSALLQHILRCSLSFNNRSLCLIPSLYWFLSAKGW